MDFEEKIILPIMPKKSRTVSNKSTSGWVPTPVKIHLTQASADKQSKNKKTKLEQEKNTKQAEEERLLNGLISRVILINANPI